MARPLNIALKNDEASQTPQRFGRWSAAIHCGLAAAALVGCRNIDNAQVDVLESELRKQEDYIYELEEYLIEYSEKLRQARIAQFDPATMPRSSSAADVKEPTLDEDLPRRPTLPMNGRDKLELPPKSSALEQPLETPGAEPEPEEVSPDQMEAPELEIGPGVQALPWKSSSVAIAAAAESPDEASPLLIPDPVDYQTEDDVTAIESGASSVPADQSLQAPLENAPAIDVSRLSADRLRIRRLFAQPDAADAERLASLLVVVEPLNATEEPVDAEGAASLMVMARDASGSLRRVERWDFTADETQAAWQSSPLGDGLHLELPLTDVEFPTGKLELWARVVKADGEKLLTQHPLEAAKLITLAEFNAEAVQAAETPPLESASPLGASESPAPASSEQTPAKQDEPTTVAMQPATTWRASTARFDAETVEGYATTASAQPGGWSSQSGGAQPPRLKPAAPTGSTKPTWKRNAATASQAQPGGALIR